MRDHLLATRAPSSSVRAAEPVPAMWVDVVDHDLAMDAAKSQMVVYPEILDEVGSCRSTASSTAPPSLPL
jgi:hypothetical protein